MMTTKGVKEIRVIQSSRNYCAVLCKTECNTYWNKQHTPICNFENKLDKIQNCAQNHNTNLSNNCENCENYERNKEYAKKKKFLVQNLQNYCAVLFKATENNKDKLKQHNTY